MGSDAETRVLGLTTYSSKTALEIRHIPKKPLDTGAVSRTEPVSRKVKPPRPIKMALLPSLPPKKGLVKDKNDHGDETEERFYACLRNALTKTRQTQLYVSEGSASIISLLRLNRRLPPDSLGQIVLDYLGKLDAGEAISQTSDSKTQSSPHAKPFDLRRLEPFATRIYESPSDLIKSYGAIYVELTNRLESLNTTRKEKSHNESFRTCVDQRLKASQNLMILQDFTRFILGSRGEEPCAGPTSAGPQSRLAAASPLEIPQRGAAHVQDDQAKRAQICQRLHAYKEAIALRNKHLIQRPADTERLFPCIIQRSVILSLISASEVLQDHNIDFDISNIGDVVKKYDALRLRKLEPGGKLRNTLRHRRSRPRLVKPHQRLLSRTSAERDARRAEWRRVLYAEEGSKAVSDLLGSL